MEITSVNNDLVKEVVKLQQKKHRDETKKFLLEGYKAVEEAISSKIKLDKILLKKGAKHNFDEKNVIYVSEQVLKKISTTTTAPEIVAVGFQRTYNLDILKDAKKVALFENINDLGNLGTILRTSTAVDIDAVVLFGDTVDIYNPKCVRASVGNLWKIPVVYIDDFSDLSKEFETFERVATLPRAKDYLKNFNVKEPMLVMFGSEANGLSEDLIKISTNSVKIEMAKTVESLNLATSVSVILYELFV